MKSLYESILDDEDVLIGDTKEFANNPLIKLYGIYSNTRDLTSQIDKVEPIVREVIDANKKEFKNVFDPSSLLFVIRFDRDDYIENRNAKCVMIELNARRLKRHVKALEEFVKKYNLEKSPLGNKHILW